MLLDIIDNFPDLDDGTDALPADELCSFCFVERLEMMQRSSYSVFDEYSQADLETVYQKCGLTGSTAMPPSLDAAPEVDPEPYCASGNLYTTSVGEKCDAIALQYNVSSAALFMANPTQSLICDGLDANMALCIPFPCDSTYVLQGNETCTSIEVAHNYRLGDVRRYNAWVSFDCRNLQPSTELYGHVICLGPQGGTYTATAPIPGVTLSPGESTGYVETVAALPVNATVANGTTQRCGKWHVAIEGDSCASICVQESITSDLFLQVNPSLPSVTNCTGALVIGDAYCVGPNPGWETPLPSPTVLPDESSSSKLASTPVSPSST